MKRRKIHSNSELAAMILEVVRSLEARIDPVLGWIDLGDPAFDGVPCSSVTLYRIARLYCEKWGYVYQPISHHCSRSYRRRAYHDIDFVKPALIKVKL